MKILSICCVVFCFSCSFFATASSIETMQDFEAYREAMVSVNKDAVLYFQAHNDEFPEVDPEMKKLYNALPPIDTFDKKIYHSICLKVLSQTEINLEDAKRQALEFYKTVLKGSEYETLLIDAAERMIYSGDFNYETNLTDALDSYFTLDDDYLVLNDGLIEFPIPESKIENCADHFQGEAGLLKAIEELTDPRTFVEHSKIKISYCDDCFLVTTIIHETGHALDYLYSLKLIQDKKPFKRVHNDEPISVFFETLFLKQRHDLLLSPFRIQSVYDVFWTDFRDHWLKKFVDDALEIKLLNSLQDVLGFWYDTKSNFVEFTSNLNEKYREIIECLDKTKTSDDCREVIKKVEDFLVFFENKLTASKFEDDGAGHMICINPEDCIFDLYRISDSKKSLAFAKDCLKNCQENLKLLGAFSLKHKFLMTLNKVIWCGTLVDTRYIDSNHDKDYVYAMSNAISICDQFIEGKMTIDQVFDRLLTKEPVFNAQAIIDVYSQRNWYIP